MNFESIAFPNWATALNICNANLWEGIQKGNEYIFKKIFIVRKISYEIY